MATTMQRESTQYVYVGLTGTVPSVSAELAFLAANVRPTSGDWHEADIVTSNADPLWADAQASGATGTFFLALLVGVYNGNAFSLTNAPYQCWVRLTSDVEQVVMICPAMFTVA